MYDKIDKIYEAVRKTYGYDKRADDLVDFLSDLAEAYDRVKREA